MQGTPQQVYICGQAVSFPYKPYPSQLVMMERVIQSLSRGEHALLESATGTGKSLALLCASLGWQSAQKQKFSQNQGGADGFSESTTPSPKLTPTTSTTVHSSDLRPTNSISSNTPSKNGAKVSQMAVSNTQTVEQIRGGSDSAKERPTKRPKTNEGIDMPDSSSGDLKSSNNTPSGTMKGGNQVTTNLWNNDDDDDFRPKIAYRKINAPKMKKPQAKKQQQKKESQTTINPQLPPPSSHVTTTAVTTETTSQDNHQTPSAESGKPPKTPTIYFGTRTHTQVAQLIGELRRTAYRPRMCVLAARDHYCIHPAVVSWPNKNHECKKLQHLNPSGCPFRLNENKLTMKPSSIWDIEDLVKKGKAVQACPYYVSRSIAKKADIVFCPYNYIIDPSIRESLGINTSGNIVIFDEAHNIEDALMGVASGDFILDDLRDDLLRQITELCRNPPLRDIYQPLLRMISEVVQWMTSCINVLQPTDFETHCNTWNGDEIVDVLQRANVSAETFNTIASATTVAEESAESGAPNSLSPKALVILQGFVKLVRILFSNNCQFVNDFRVVIQKTSSHTPGRSAWTHTLGIWCLSPRVAFHGLADARAFILTSGTLSPMDSYASELGATFPLRAELGHVIDMERQVWVGAVSHGPRGEHLNTSFKNSDLFSVQDALGDTLLAYIKKIPSGVLCFFPSYSLLDRITQRWKSTGLWSRLQSFKSVHVEPRASGAEFSAEMTKYYKGAKSATGAILLAVCRGKVSEGVDFTDHYARAVIVIGIPYPNVIPFTSWVANFIDQNRKDLRVGLKQKYNDIHAKEYQLLDGKRWYEQQAFRALNQAIGRCIRHKLDYGAIILLDERYCDTRVTNNLSKWAKNYIKRYQKFEESVESLVSFFDSVTPM